MFSKAPVKRFNEGIIETAPPPGAYDPKFVTDCSVIAQQKSSNSAIVRSRSKQTSRSASPAPAPASARRNSSLTPQSRTPLAAIHKDVKSKDSALKEKLSVLEQQYAEAISKLEALEIEKLSLQSEVAKVAALNAENMTLQTQLSNMQSKDKENELLKSQLASMQSTETENVALRSQVLQMESFKNENQVLNTDVSKMQIENLTLNEKITEMYSVEKENKDLKLTVSKMQSVEKKNQELQDKLTKLNFIEKENQDLKAQLSKMQHFEKKNVTLQTQILKLENLEKEIVNIRIQISKLEEEKLNSKNVELSLNAKIAELNKSNEESAQTISELEKEVDKHKGQVFRLTGDLEEWEREKEILKKEKQQAVEKLEEMSSKLIDKEEQLQTQFSLLQESEQKCNLLEKNMMTKNEMHQQELNAAAEEKASWLKREKEMEEKHKFVKGQVESLTIALVAEKSATKSSEKKFQEMSEKHQNTITSLKNGWKEKEEYLVKEIEHLGIIVQKLDASPDAFKSKEAREKLHELVKISTSNHTLWKQNSFLQEAKSQAELNIIGGMRLQLVEEPDAVQLSQGEDKCPSPMLVSTSISSFPETSTDLKSKIENLKTVVRDIAQTCSSSKEKLEKTKQLINAVEADNQNTRREICFIAENSKEPNSIPMSEKWVKGAATMVPENKLPLRQSGSIKLATILEEEDDKEHQYRTHQNSTRKHD